MGLGRVGASLGVFRGVRKVVLGVLGKFLVIFGIWKDGGRFLGIWRVWKDLEGFRGILKGGMISGDFYRYLTPLVSIGTVFYFSKSGNTLPCW